MPKDNKVCMVVVFAAAVLLAGCSAGNPQADQADEVALVTPISPTELPAPTATPLTVPTSTEAAPTAASTATRTSVPSPTASASPSPAPTATTPVVVSADDLQRVTAEEAKALVDEGRAVLYDVRSAGTYLGRHAAGALSFPEADLAERYGELPTDKALIFY
jgi:hypothetical protein